MEDITLTKRQQAQLLGKLGSLRIEADRYGRIYGNATMNIMMEWMLEQALRVVEEALGIREMTESQEGDQGEFRKERSWSA